MIEIQIGKIEYKCPTSYEDITVRKYQNYIELIKNKSIFKNDIDLITNIISLMIDIEIDILKKLKADNILLIQKALSFLNNDIDISKYDNKGKLEINGQLFMFNKNMNNLTLGEYIDFDILTKDPIENLHKISALMYRPIKKQSVFEKMVGKYELIQYDSNYLEITSELFLDLKITDLIACIGFFLRFQQIYIEVTKTCLENQMLKMEKKKMKNISN
jgi:hypothetical protein